MSKKLIYLTTFVLVLGLFLTNVAEGIDPNLVGYWMLDGNANDSSGLNNHGTIYGGPQWVGGKIGSDALDFDGTDDYVDCGNDPSLQITGTEITVASWVIKGPISKYQVIAGKSTDENWSDGYGLSWYLSEVNFYVGGWGTGGPASEPFPTDGQWHHVAGTYDGSNVKIWVDGVEGTTPFPYTGSVNGSGGSFEIGRMGEWPDYCFSGTLDDVRVYNRVLTEAEIQQFLLFPEASEPNPADEATGVHPEVVVLSWTPGMYADKHDVYFGTDETKVTDASRANTLGVLVSQNQDANSYPIPETLDFGETYYWRIDEVNVAEEPNMWQGNVWNFAIAEYLVVDDMESYGGADVPGVPGSRITYTWIDGGGWNKPPPPNKGNGTGSVIGHADPPYVETVITHGGGQSMPYYYDNAQPRTDYYSEASADTADLVIGSNWASTKILSLWFYGDPSNDANETMYVALEDAGNNVAVVEYDGDMNDIKIDDWQEWPIVLQDFNDLGVNLADVSTIHLGFGIRGNTTTPGGSGLVFFDDIRLYAAGCFLSLRSDDFAIVDYVEDCVVDYKEVEVMATDWLFVVAAPGDANLVGHWKLDGDANDSSAHNNHGTIYGDPQWVAGKIGSDALDFDGTDDYVDCGNNPSLQITGTEITVAAWVIKGPISKYQVIAGKSTDETWSDGFGLLWYLSEVKFYVGGWGTGGPASEPFPTDGQWHHVAGTYDGSNVKIWVDGVEGTTPFPYTGSVNGSSGSFEIGRQGGWPDYCFSGTLDDVRTYNVALTESDIMSLTTDVTLKVDLYEDLKIDFKDLAELAAWWMDEQLQ